MKIDLVHALPETSSAFGNDHDGFSAAMQIVAQEHDVRWINVHPANADHRTQRSRIADGDVVLVRSDWGWYPDRAAARTLALTGRPCVLLIAGSSPPPPLAQQLRYDALLYETPWYEQFVSEHPRAVRAFGVDTSVMHDHGHDRDIDHLFVGRLASFKRPLRLLEKSGRRVAVGDFSSAPADTRDALLAEGVELVDHVGHPDLAELYNRARSVFIPCELQGGGERAVLEGRACGCAVEIADDNPKLASLLTVPVSSHELYAEQILECLKVVADGDQIPRMAKATGFARFEAENLTDKLRRAPQSLKIRARNLSTGRRTR